MLFQGKHANKKHKACKYNHNYIDVAIFTAPSTIHFPPRVKPENPRITIKIDLSSECEVTGTYSSIPSTSVAIEYE